MSNKARSFCDGQQTINKATFGLRGIALSIVSLVAIAGCAQYPNGAAQPVSLESEKLCLIASPNGASKVYTGPDGKAVPMTGPQCVQANEEARRGEAEALRVRAADEQRVAQRQTAERQRVQTRLEQVINQEKALGYRHQTVRDLLLDGKALAAQAAKVSVTGFYKALNRRNERFYVSYNDYMMHQYQSVEAQNIGLLTSDGSRRLREYLLRCEQGCQLTILGHVTACVETNAFGRSTSDFCLAADDMRAVEGGT
jgi:hypothetical protein